MTYKQHNTDAYTFIVTPSENKHHIFDDKDHKNQISIIFLMLMTD